MESPVPPVVIPIYHLGMDQILPNEPPYRLQIRKKVTMNYGEPIDFSELIQKLRISKASETEVRKAITERIQDELQRYIFVHVSNLQQLRRKFFGSIALYIFFLFFSD